MKFREIISRKEKKEEAKFKPAPVKPAPPAFEKKAPFSPEVGYKNAVSWVDTLFSKIDAGESVNESPEENVNLFIDMLSSDKSKVIRMAYTPPQGSYVPMHSVNICILSLAIGQEMRLPYKDLIKLGTTSLVHCVGRHRFADTIKIRHSIERLKAKEKWIEDINLLDKVPGIDADIRLIIYQHHEMIDDMELPILSLKGELHPLTKILSIVDFYITMTQPPEKTRVVSSDVALTAILEANSAPFDAEVIKSFIKVVGFYPVGSWVKLSTGEIGKVLEENEESPMRPIVEIVFNPDGKELKVPKHVDLSQIGMVHIKGTIDERHLPRLPSVRQAIHTVSTLSGEAIVSAQERGKGEEPKIEDLEDLLLIKRKSGEAIVSAQERGKGEEPKIEDLEDLLLIKRKKES